MVAHWIPRARRETIVLAFRGKQSIPAAAHMLARSIPLHLISALLVALCLSASAAEQSPWLEIHSTLRLTKTLPRSVR